MGTSSDTGSPGRDETEKERHDRQLVELLNEVRVAMPGVQVLFGFLLAVPFQQRFDQTTAFQRYVFLTTLLCSAGATAFLVAPVAYHRLLFMMGEKQLVVEQANRSLLVGLVLLACAMIAAVVLVVDVIFSRSTVLAVTIPLTLLFAVLWFGIGLVNRAQA